ncbi:hypothetical protein CMUS01_10964 [Colletotrichum musicola]|uniref:Uncharacterized protein n=1 Tax=Colletotrichum musicola TaxID=2175873 RepID=A0A8H6N7P8_9PEZI|nr:hypothetical protein CMUS01_10964 [Colletotrichum musicola]
MLDPRATILTSPWKSGVVILFTIGNSSPRSLGNEPMFGLHPISHDAMSAEAPTSLPLPFRTPALLVPRANPLVASAPPRH